MILIYIIIVKKIIKDNNVNDSVVNKIIMKCKKKLLFV